MIRVRVVGGYVGPAGLGVVIHARRQRELEAFGLLAGFMLGRHLGGGIDRVLEGFALAATVRR